MIVTKASTYIKFCIECGCRMVADRPIEETHCILCKYTDTEPAVEQKHTPRPDPLQKVRKKERRAIYNKAMLVGNTLGLSLEDRKFIADTVLHHMYGRRRWEAMAYQHKLVDVIEVMIFRRSFYVVILENSWSAQGKHKVYFLETVTRKKELNQNVFRLRGHIQLQ